MCMVTEYQVKCKICGSESWFAEKPEECTYCSSEDLESIDTRERDESKGVCTVGEDDCQLVATHRAETKDINGEDTRIQKICKEHYELWDGLDGVVKMWKV